MATEKEIKDHITLKLNNLLQSADAAAPPERTGKVVDFLFKFFLSRERKFEPEGSFFDYETRVSKSASLLGIDEKTYLEKVALRQPSLLHQSPETIHDNIKGAAMLLGVDKETYIKKAILKQPSLCAYDPERVFKNYVFIKGAHTAGFITDKENSIDMVMKTPSALMSSERSISLRTIYAAMTGQSFKLSTFLRGNNRDNGAIETGVVSWLKDQFKRTGFGDQTVRNMHRNGLISKLPEWAAETASP